jgi:adenylate kinase
VRQEVVAVTGLSGVGKSTLLATVSPVVPMQVLYASSLIRSAREAIEGEAVALDILRTRNLDENQRLLVHGFDQQKDPAVRLVVLDCHAVIEAGDDLVRIDPTVFGAVGITAMIFLVDRPEEIANRRLQDASRGRPVTAVKDLRAVQDAAVDHARTICDRLNVPLHVCQVGSAIQTVKELLSSYAVGANNKRDSCELDRRVESNVASARRRPTNEITS